MFDSTFKNFIKSLYIRDGLKKEKVKILYYFGFIAVILERQYKDFTNINQLGNIKIILAFDLIDKFIGYEFGNLDKSSYIENLKLYLT